MPASTAAIIASSLISAASSQVAASKQRSSSRKIAAAKLEQDRKLARAERSAQLEGVEKERQSARAQDRLVAAKGTQLSNQALGLKNIKARPLKSFSDITRNVLDEGSSVG